MNKPEQLATLCTQSTGHRRKTSNTKHTTQKTKKMRNTDPTKNMGEHRCPLRVSNSHLTTKGYKKKNP
jgi:hypothetical protein